MRYSSHSKPKEPEEEDKKGDPFNFELVNGENATPPEMVEKTSSKGTGSDGDLIDLAKDSFYIQKKEEGQVLDESMGSWERKLLDPRSSIVMVTNEECTDLQSEIKLESANIHVKDNYFD